MPVYNVSFNLSQVFTEGAIQIEADSPEAALELVEGMDPDKLMDCTSGVEWVTDVYENPELVE